MAALHMRVTAPPPRGQWLSLLGFVVVVFAVAAVAAIASTNAQPFYAALIKPTWAPPAGVFGPVWSVLYTLMAVAAWLVWRTKGNIEAAGAPLALFAGQLFVNGLWSWLFFRWQLGALALVDTCLLWLLLLATLVQFWRVNLLAGLLLLPYLLWVSFATALTAATWRMNPAVL
ncbi:MAG: TspO/MBR family protein [Pseudomonadota bacterium]